jgi:hypothetical protein
VEESVTIRRRPLHRVTFAAAGTYNIAWGIYSAFDPQWLFRFAGMPPMRYPEIFACLAMTIGLCGVLYLDVARRPERGQLIAAVGLAGKILGPIGFFVLVLGGAWPWKTIVLILTNDVIWWAPFAVYLWDSCRVARSHGAALCIATARN